MHARLRFLSAVLITGLLASLIVGCSGSGSGKGAPTPAPAKRERQVAVVGVSTNPSVLDPGATSSGVDAIIFFQTIYENLVDWQTTEAKIRPQLAERWDASVDGKEWTFYLRKDVKFHDGTPFNAEAVKFNYDRQLDPNHPYAPKQAPMGQAVFGAVQEIKVVDDSTVKLILKYPYAPLLANLTIFSAGIASPTAIKKYGQDYPKHPVGTGPYMFDSWQADVSVNLARNPNWWDTEGASKQQYPVVKPGNEKRPYLDGVIYKVIPQLSVQTEEMIKGTVHVPYNVSTDDADRLKNSPTIDFKADPSAFTTGYLGFNVTQNPFDNVKLRQAIAMAIDKEAIVKNVFSGWMRPAKSLIMPGMVGYPKDIKDYAFDVAAAKKLMAEAGYPNGLTTVLWTHSNPRTTNPKGAKLAEALQPMLAAIGIKAEIKVLEWPAYLAALKDGTMGMFTYGWGSDNFDPDNTLWLLMSSKNIPAGNRTRWKNPKADELLDQAQQVSDPAKRDALYQQVEQMVHDEVPLIPLNHNFSIWARNKALKGTVVFGDLPGYWWLEANK